MIFTRNEDTQSKEAKRDQPPPLGDLTRRVINGDFLDFLKIKYPHPNPRPASPPPPPPRLTAHTPLARRMAKAGRTLMGRGQAWVERVRKVERGGIPYLPPPCPTGSNEHGTCSARVTWGGWHVGPMGRGGCNPRNIIQS